jgi:hypothetical protein
MRLTQGWDGTAARRDTSLAAETSAADSSERRRHLVL